MIRFVCFFCRKRCKAPDAYAGKYVRCPRCHARLVVPVPESSFADLPTPPAPSVPPVLATEAVDPKAVGSRSDMLASSRSITVPCILFAVGLFLVVAGLVRTDYYFNTFPDRAAIFARDIDPYLPAHLQRKILPFPAQNEQALGVHSGLTLCAVGAVVILFSVYLMTRHAGKG